MIRHAFIFIGTFVLGAVVTLAVRTARHDPHAGHLPAPATPAPAAHTPAAAAAKPVNTVCAICGMAVDPRLPTAVYRGQVIGFGCRMCPPKFQANPDKYGPAYLRNEGPKGAGQP